MKARICSVSLLVALLLSLSVGASAAGNIVPLYDSAARCTPVLSFSGRTSICSGTIKAKESSARITATMTLYRVNSNTSLSTVASWPAVTGTGSIYLSKTYSKAVSGNTYRLVLSGTVKDSTGTHSISSYAQAQCP